MSGRGKTRKSLGKADAKRRRKVLLHMVERLIKPALPRLARRAGIKGVSGLNYKMISRNLLGFLETAIRECIVSADLAKRKTITAMDVVKTLRRLEITQDSFVGIKSGAGCEEPALRCAIPVLTLPCELSGMDSHISEPPTKQNGTDAFSSCTSKPGVHGSSSVQNKGGN